MSRPIPSRPNLEKDRKAAKALKKAHAERAPDALARIREQHPRFRGRSDAELAAAQFRLSDAQLVVAREYGVESWPRWKALAGFLCADFDARLALFLEAAVADDRTRSRDLLAHAEGLARGSLQAACAAGEEAAAGAILARDPDAATRPDGPCRAQPLWTLCFSNLRLGERAAGEARLRIARLLLERGADPSATATKDSDFGPFAASALYGTIARNQPELTQLLLEAGADPNDGESLYHSTEHRDGRCLRLLLAHGARIPGSNALLHALDFADPAPAHLLLEAGADPNEAGPCGGAALHHAARRARAPETLDLLLRHGAAIDVRDRDGRTPYAIARRLGNRAAAEHLLGRGASEALSEADRFAAACSAGDEREARALLARDPDLVERLGGEELGLLVEAAGLDHREGVRLMLDLGFPVDTPGGVHPSTALNVAAYTAHVELVELLLARGADPEAVNHFGGTALGALAWSSKHPDGVDVRGRSEERRQRDLVLAAERLLAAGARILPQHLGNASPPLAELLRRHGAADAED
jgi:ankyrin repeat protein